METIKKSILASFLIGLGVIANFQVGQPLGPFFFAMGLVSVYYLKANLFTGKCGFVWRDNLKELGFILFVNLVAGYTFGIIAHFAYPNLIILALDKVGSWSFSLPFFLQSMYCGMVMYLAIRLARDTLLGFVFVPLFIFSGFQHCIANVIVCGIGLTFSWTLLMCIIGNFIGSVIVNLLDVEEDSNVSSPKQIGTFRTKI